MSITKDAGLFMAAKVGEGLVEGLQQKAGYASPEKA